MSPEANTVRLLTFREAARVLSVSLRQFRRIIDDGRIAFVKVSPRAPRVRSDHLQAFIAKATESHSAAK